jgi:hypothetical protein
MDRLRALENDYGLLGGRGLRGINMWAVLRCTVYRCPYCRWIFKLTWGPFNSLLGTGERACWHCKQVFWDSSNEWPDMSSEDQQLFLLPITVAGYIAGFLVVVGLYSCVLIAAKKHASWHELIFLLEFALPIVLWFCFRGVQVIRSVHRYNNRVPQGPS